MIGNKPMRPPPPHYYTYGKRDGYESKAKGVSISASVLSILIYISVFYIFDLSPSIVLNSSKFWFFISNTLIIIIAADYGSFSSSCDEVDDLYDEYVATSRQTMSAIYHQPCYTTHTNPIPSYHLHVKNPPHIEEGIEDEDGVFEVKNMIFSTLIEPKVEEEEEEIVKELVLDETWKVPTQDSIWESISIDTNNKVLKENASHRSIIKHVHEDCKKMKKFRRTVSEKLPETTHHERKNVIHRWDSERHEPLVAENEHKKQEHEREEEMESDRFETMTDEELNKRVEDFIQKFNRHIRLERNINF